MDAKHAGLRIGSGAAGSVLGFLAVLIACTGALAAEVANPYGDQSLLAQPRASKVHDRVTVLVELNTSARHEANTETTKESTTSWNFDTLFEIGKDDDGDIVFKPFDENRKPNLDFETEREHSGEGETATTESIEAEISGEVVDVLPNKHLVVEARRSITFKNEKSIVRFTGRVDPRDLSADNTVSIRYVIDPCIELLGEGDITDAVKKGWLSKFFDAVSPF